MNTITQTLRGVRELEPFDMMPRSSFNHTTQALNIQNKSLNDLPVYRQELMNSAITPNMAFKERGCKDELYSHIVIKPTSGRKKLFLPYIGRNVNSTPLMPQSSNFSASLNSHLN